MVCNSIKLHVDENTSKLNVLTTLNKNYTHFKCNLRCI